ncbi:hypothetical protein F5888DRAFT_1799306 [Russula emetica]|nr:hypothetical protein F5888DRAFT_1799306 [Russula emetica]
MDSLPRNASFESPPAVIPPPWTFKAKLYLFTTPLEPVDPEDPLLQGLPPGSYNPEETIHPSALVPVKGSPQWNGGMLNVIIVRYEDSPIGPYDELIASTDGFANPFEKGTSARITNIYVDSTKSIWHGRKLWNIPKHLARFEFAQTNSKTISIKVSLPDAKDPFFSASVTESSIPSIPIPSFIMNPFVPVRIVQPPLLASNPPDILIASNEEWISLTPEYRGRWGVAYIEPSEGGNELYGDGLHYPQIQPYWIGAKFSGNIHLDAGVRYTSSEE